MPNRVVREGILDSDRITVLVEDAGWAAEVFYRRLMSIVDDFGRHEARTSPLKSRLYPTLSGRIRDADVERWIAACEKAGLIRVYAVNDKRYVEILDFRQRTRAKSSKCPPPAGRPPPHDGHPQANVRRMTAKTETETEAQPESEAQSSVGYGAVSERNLPVGTVGPTEPDRLLRSDHAPGPAGPEGVRDPIANDAVSEPHTGSMARFAGLSGTGTTPDAVERNGGHAVAPREPPALGPGGAERFRQIFYLQVCSAMKLPPAEREAQRDSIMAVANRVLQRADSGSLADDIVELARRIKAQGAAVRKPMARWQKRVNEILNGSGVCRP